MIKFEELVKSPEYWMETFQNTLYGEVKEYLEKKGINQTQLANDLGVTKGYISQVMKGNFNYTLRKLIDLSLAIGKVPAIEFKTPEEYAEKEKMHWSSASINLGENKFIAIKGGKRNVNSNDMKPDYDLPFKAVNSHFYLEVA